MPALLIYNDNTHLKFVDNHHRDYNISANNYQVRTHQNGTSYSVYNIGLALLWLPFFLIAHLVASLSNYASDGLSAPYQWTIILCSLCYITLGFYYLRKLLLEFFTDKVVALTLISIAFATNWFYYATQDIALTHLYLFSLQAIFLYYIYQYNKNGTAKYLILSGLLLGIMTLIRSSEILLIIIPVFWGFNPKELLKHPIKLLFNLTKRGIQYTFLALPIFFLQILYYKISNDVWFIDGYNDHKFDWLDTHIYDCLFSYRRGWFIYTPIMCFITLGFYYLLKNMKQLFWAILIFTFVYCYVVFSWEIWWYGNTFGCRPVVQNYATLALPLATFYYAILKNNTRRNLMILFTISCFIFLNLFQTWQYNKRILPLDFINKSYYWKVFLKKHKDNHDKILLDFTDSRPDLTNKNLTLYKNKFPLYIRATSNNIYSEYTKVLNHPVNYNNVRAFTNKWLQIRLSLTYKGSAYTKWKHPSLIVHVSRNQTKNNKNKTLLYKQLRIPHVINDKSDSLNFGLNLPHLKEGDLIKFYFQNKTRDSIEINNLEIDIWE